MKENLNPVIVGVSQYKQSKTIEEPLDPLRLIIKVSKQAIKDIKTPKIKNSIDHIYMVNINSWSYKDAPKELSDALDLTPLEKTYLSDGGNTPQLLVNRAARKIAMGDASAILITGGEAAYSLYQSKKGNRTLNWPKKEIPSYMEGEIWHGINEFENKYKLIVPSYSYALFETALRHKKTRSTSEHNNVIGNLFHHFSQIASQNPYAWSQKVYTKKRIITPSKKNRLINHPYTKRMCSNMFVDQSAAIVMTTDKLAQKLEIPQKLWVYPMGGADYENVFSICQRPELYTSPAARYGCQDALSQSGLQIEDIDAFDIYSCFHSIVEIIKREIGIPKKKKRDLTLTGGLPYFGGPWSNYSLHAIAKTVSLIRKDPSKKIMVVANGGYNTKQSFGIYGKEPPKISWDTVREKKSQKLIFQKQLPEPIHKAEGFIKIEGHTIIYNREGIPEKGIVIGTLNQGPKRTLAFLKGNSRILLKLANLELVGISVPVHFSFESGYNIISATSCLDYVENNKS
ncbi:MAG: hypothetical protein P8Y70_15810 [Candidatus Lokiarchaeota archaeon]